MATTMKRRLNRVTVERMSRFNEHRYLYLAIIWMKLVGRLRNSIKQLIDDDLLLGAELIIQLLQ